MKSKIMIALAVFSAPLVTSAADLSGPYIGAYLSRIKGHDKGIEINTATGVADGFTQNTSPSGQALGLMGGYTWFFKDGLVMGVEANYESRSISDNTIQKNNGVSDPDYPFKTKLGATYSLQGKIGYAFNAGKTVVYGAYGTSTAKIKRTFIDLPASDSLSDTVTVKGQTVGLGAEHLVQDNISVMIDYHTTDYENIGINVGSLWPNTAETQNYNENVWRLGAAYRF